MKRLFFTVTNDLSYDQRMIRICTTLARAGYKVTLVGRQLPDSISLVQQPFRQKRIHCYFHRGKRFYAEYSIRLFFYLLFKRMSCVCAIDLDTILPCFFISRFKGVHRAYDAHELFCEMKEVVTRPRIYKFWKWIENFAVPRFPFGYTVDQPITDEFRRMYWVKYRVVRNLPVLRELDIPAIKEKTILYQGAVNEGRSFETLIPAMKDVAGKLIIAGTGNFIAQAQELVRVNHLEDKVIFVGKIPPHELFDFTRKAYIGVTLFENKGLSNYLSLANRFFDYFHAGLPQLCVDYPAYREINKSHRVAVLIDDLRPETIAARLNELLDDQALYLELQQNCLKAREQLNWQQEEKALLSFYQSLFRH